MNEPDDKKTEYRWSHLRLRFLLIAIPIGGLIIGMILGEASRLDRENAFEQELLRWNAEQYDYKYLQKVFSGFIKRRTHLKDVLSKLRGVHAYGRGDLVWLTPKTLADALWCYALRVDADQRVIGAADLHFEWEAGFAPELGPDILRARKILFSFRLAADRADVVKALKDAGFQPDGSNDSPDIAFLAGSRYRLILFELPNSTPSTPNTASKTFRWFWTLQVRPEEWQSMDEFLNSKP